MYVVELLTTNSSPEYAINHTITMYGSYKITVTPLHLDLDWDRNVKN